MEPCARLQHPHCPVAKSILHAFFTDRAADATVCAMQMGVITGEIGHYRNTGMH